jgi:hypothetical protein
MRLKFQHTRTHVVAVQGAGTDSRGAASSAVSCARRGQPGPAVSQQV